MDDDFLPISALNDLLFCERRCALHRIEQVWTENRYTLEGSAAHRKVHAEPTAEEVGASGRLVRGMWLRSERMRLVGVADLVEFRPSEVVAITTGVDQPNRPMAGAVVYPVEFKRGKRRRWDNDDVQLCAQALCLEEMLAVSITAGAVYHVRSRRRREVAFDEPLRAKTAHTAVRLHELVASGQTPPPVLKPRCRGCSLHAECFPEVLSRPAQCNRYLQRLYQIHPEKSDAG